MRRLQPISPPPELLIGSGTGDDAAIWRLDESRALVVTADFITPIVDDAAAWGRIAAANSVSDVYAMGGRPLLALNLVCWNTAELSTDLLGEVLDGGLAVAAQAGFFVVGGHTVDDPEPKYGMAVIGEVHPDRLLTNAGLRPGDVLVLTKPLGVGVIATAIKRGEAEAVVVATAVESMTRLNDEASRVALASGATGATDVTGFGLLGHLGRMAQESRVDVMVDAGSVPLLPGAWALAAAGVVPGGTERNLAAVTSQLDRGLVDAIMVTLLADAQTSGGLVFGVAPGQDASAVELLRATGHEAAVIGHVTGPGSGRIALR